MTNEHLKQKEIEFKEQYQKALEWAQFVQNPQILESQDHAEIKEYLDKLIAGIEKRYQGNSPQFPSSSELAQLTAVIFTAKTEIMILSIAP